MKRILFILGALALGACDDKAAPPIGGGGGGGGGFGAFVIDLIEHHTSDKEASVAVDFTTSDSQAADEFSSLFE